MAKKSSGSKRVKVLSVKGVPKAPAMPVCTAFVICDNVIIGEDTTATLVRMVDTIGLPTDSTRKKGDMIGISGITVFVSLKKGTAPEGNYEIFLDCLSPKDERTRIGKLQFKATGEAATGTNIRTQFGVRWSGVGSYWYELRLKDGRLIGRTPFKLVEGSPEQVRRIVLEDYSKAALASVDPTAKGKTDAK